MRVSGLEEELGACMNQTKSGEESFVFETTIKLVLSGTVVQDCHMMEKMRYVGGC